MLAIVESLRDLPVVIGGGLAGLMTALHLAPGPVVVLTKSPLVSEASSAFAQGGIAAALADDDSPAFHAADTLAAGDGLCDREVVERVTRAAPEAIKELMRRGVVFDCDTSGRLKLGLEAAHSHRRIVHAQGDQTGHAIMRALADAVRRTHSITVMEGVEARRLILEDGRIAGVLALTATGPILLPSTRVIIATGGIGGLYRHTTNPLGSIGQGLILAARAGATLADMEFVQFHPTALDVGLDPMPLVSEAVRGEGASLVDETGTRFMEGQGRAELEPRDIVARAVWRHLMSGHRVFLDAREALGDRFSHRFPAITQACHRAGFDPASMPIPVRPAAHYHMGGIMVDGAGRTSVKGLWACGEAAATGLHGANRLASNSLLEATVCARWVAESVAGIMPGRSRNSRSMPVPSAPDATEVREIMSRHVGVLRDDAMLNAAVSALQPLAFGASAVSDPAVIGLMIATAALIRQESRGAHCRTDHPKPSARLHRLTLRLADGAIDARFMPTEPAVLQPCASEV